MIENALIILLAYVVGSVPTGYVLGLRAGVDIRQSGSGNIGATNVARVVGKRQGIFTLVGDVAKGLIPVMVASHLGLSTATIGAVATAAFLGHLYPVFLRFKGGKGVATALGVFLGMAPLATAILLVVFAVVVLVSRIVSVASMTTAGMAPVILWLLSYPVFFVGVSIFLGSMIILRHRSNIQRLIAGTEPRFKL